MYKNGMSQKQIATVLKTNARHVRDSLKRTDTPSRGKGNRKEKNPAWKGGRKIDRDGYVLIHCPEHPNATKQGYVREHRLVVEKTINRYLTKREVVHHKNGNHSDNRIENLILFSDNGTHLALECFGKKPKWTKEGLQKMKDRKAPSMKGMPQCSPGNGARTLRKKQIQKLLLETSNLEDIEPGEELPKLPPAYQRKSKKHETEDVSPISLELSD
jgi:hypothetical protein